MNLADKYRQELLEDIVTTELFGLRGSDEVEGYLCLLNEEAERIGV